MTTITAKSGKKGQDDYKEYIGDFELPENLEEAVLNYGTGDVFDAWMRNHVVGLQATLRKPDGAKVTATIETYKRLRPFIDKQIMTDEEARKASGYEGPWPLA